MLLENTWTVLLVTHQCSYLCHIIQTVEYIFSCFLWLNPRLCLMIIWRLLKTGHKHWLTLPCNQLQIMCHFPHVPHPVLIRDHHVSLACLDTIHMISARVMRHLLCHKVIYLFYFTSEHPLNYGGSLTSTLAWGSTSCPSQKLTDLSPWGQHAAKQAGTGHSGLTCFTRGFDCKLKYLPFFSPAMS